MRWVSGACSSPRPAAGLGAAGIKVAQDHAAKSAIFVEFAQNSFDHGFRVAVGADGSEGSIFRNRGLRRLAINGGGRREDKTLYIGAGHGLEQRQRTADIVGEIKLGLLSGFANGDIGGEVHDCIDALQQLGDGVRILEAGDV